MRAQSHERRSEFAAAAAASPLVGNASQINQGSGILGLGGLLDRMWERLHSLRVAVLLLDFIVLLTMVLSIISSDVLAEHRAPPPPFLPHPHLLRRVSSFAWCLLCSGR